MTNAEFFVGKAEEVLPEKYEKEGITADVIVVDPPRKGCEESVLATMIQMAPKRIVYVRLRQCDSGPRPEVSVPSRLRADALLPDGYVWK